MPEPATIRIFLVGFPRSGTTLLQSLLAAHPEVFSLPETFFFFDVAPEGRRWRLLRRAHPRGRQRLEQLAEQGVEVVAPDPLERLPVATLGPTVERFVRSLDATAGREGKRAWVEKTPAHLHRLAAIERYVPDARIVHMLREGMPAVASLRAVTQQHPQPWGGARPVEECVARWRGDVRRSYSCRSRDNHSFVSYERLVTDPAAVLAALLPPLGLSADAETIRRMVSGYGEAAPGLIAEEPWKATVGAPIADRNGDRAESMFSDTQRRGIEREIAVEKGLFAELPFA